MLPAKAHPSRRILATTRDVIVDIEKEINSAECFSELVAAADLVERVVGWYEKQRLRDMMDRAWMRFQRKCIAVETSHV